MSQHIFTGTAPPATTPTGIGHHYIDTTNKVSYVSVGTSSSADWEHDAAAVAGDLATHIADTANPHAVTKTQVGLGNVDNTSDVNKPVSTLQATAIGLKKDDSMSTNKLLGRGTAGTGVIEEITLGTNLSLTGTTLNAAGGVSFPLQPAIGTASAPPYSFNADADTGMYSAGNGSIDWTNDGVLGMSLSPAHDLTVVGNIAAANYPPTGGNNRFALFDSGGAITSLGELSYDNTTKGLSLSHGIVPANPITYNNLHNIYAAFNPTVVDAQDSWVYLNLGCNVGSDDSGNQMGDPSDVKSVLVVQDLTFTAKRYGTDGDVISIEYTTGGTAGSEVVTESPTFEYSVQIQSGVSTANQIKTALEAFNGFPGNVVITVSGVGSNAQVAAAQAYLAGGENQNGALTSLNTFIGSTNKSNVGQITNHTANISLGNGTDQIDAYRVRNISTNLSCASNTSIDSYTGVDVGVNISSTNAITRFDFRGFQCYGQAGEITNGLIGLQAGFNFQSAGYVNGITTSFDGGDVLGSVNAYSDFSNYDVIADGYYGISIQPNIADVQYLTAVNVSPNATLVNGTAYGIYVNMSGVTMYAGVKPSVTIQDLFIEAITAGSYLNSLTIEYVDDGTAGAETVGVAGLAVTVHMESGVSTATQIRTALLANFNVAGNLNVTVSGVGSNTQTDVGPTNLTGGIDPGNKKAAYFDGDVQINGALSFSGALSIGALNAYQPFTLVDGGGTPSSAHSLISAPTAAANATTANADFLGINTAALITLGDNSVTTTSFLGISALGLPAVLNMGTGSTVDHVAGATFALSLDGGATGGTVDLLELCKAIALPNGITTVNKVRAYAFGLPFGDPGTETWGAYMEPDCFNWFKGSIKIGGTAGTTDKASTGLKLHVEGDSLFDGEIGFFNTPTVAQQPSSGVATAGGTYTATEQTMIQEMYDALRAYGLLT
jgi:hypothetical protein